MCLIITLIYIKRNRDVDLDLEGFQSELRTKKLSEAEGRKRAMSFSGQLHLPVGPLCFAFTRLP